MVSDDDLNRAMAIECGWKCSSDETVYSAGGGLIKPGYWVSRGGKSVCAFYPHFCSDRNTLPEIKQAISDAGAEFEFSREMRDVCINLPEWEKSRTFTVAFAEPRHVVVAALKALGKMPGEGGA